MHEQLVVNFLGRFLHYISLNIGRVISKNKKNESGSNTWTTASY